MRRVLLALGGTVAGLIMLLSFKSHPASTAAAGVGASGAGGAGSSAAGPGGSAAGGSGAGSVTGSGSPAASGGAASGGTVVGTGQAVSTAYGPMQVQATLTGGRITGVKVLQQTNGALSQQIDASAIPELTKEALTAQSARIHAVSGATYTSAGYIQSLQSALDKARS
jgi:uncharacterized protein with FMN-binding domain